MNLSQHMNRFYQDLRQPNQNRYSKELVIEYLDEAERVVNNIAKSIRSSSVVASVADTRLYTLPTDILNYQIDDILYSVTDSTERRRLTPITISTLDRISRSWKETTGTPTHWYIDRLEGKYGVYPYEKTVHTGTECIKIKYRAKHTKMTNFYTTGTVDVVNGSASVSGTSTAFIGNVVADDELGIGKLLDRTTVFPTTFFGIASTPAADDALTLSSAYTGANANTQSYIISSPSSIENDELNLCAVLLAMALAKKKDGDYNGYQALWGAGISRIERELAGIEDDAADDERMIPDNVMPSPGNIVTDY